MQFHRALGAAKSGPVVHRQAKVDRGRVDTDQLIREAELLFALRLDDDLLEQAVEDLLEQLPRTVAVGIGQRRAGRDFDPQMGQFALAALQTTLDFPKRMGPAELAEQHPHELTPARQPLPV